MYRITLIPKENIAEIIPFLQLLDSSISASVLQERLLQMFDSGYKCVGVYDGGKLVGLSGMWILVKYYIGKHIEPDNVIMHPDYQNKNIGVQLIEWMHEYARQQGCVAAELNCYITNTKGQKFWTRHGYELKALHYRKML